MKKHSLRSILAILMAFCLLLPFVSNIKGFTAIAADSFSSEQTTSCTGEPDTSQSTPSTHSDEAVEETASSQADQEEIIIQNITEKFKSIKTFSEKEKLTEFPALTPPENISLQATVEGEIEEELNARLASGSTILSAGSWGEGYYWYIQQGAPLYVFCLDHGVTMYSGKYTFVEKWDTLYDAQTTFRMAVALDYFKKNGGLYSLAGYEDAQRAIWGTGGTIMSDQLIEYANNLWQLTEVNPFRTSGTNSYKNISAVRQQDISTQNSRRQLYQSDMITRKVQLNKTEGPYDVNNRTISVGGAAWKYFAAGTPNGWGTLEIEGCYSSSGQKLSAQNAKASISADGKIKVSFNQKFGSFGTADDPVMVVVKADLGLQGAAKLNYLDSGTGKQRMSYDVSPSSPSLFSLKVYTARTDEKEATISIRKVDNLNQPIDGAVFTLVGRDANGKIVYPIQKIITNTDENNVFKEIEKEGTYLLEETAPPPGMKNSGIKIKLKATKTETATGSKITLSTIGTLPSHVKLNKTGDSTGFTYTITNEYESGSAYLQKLGNVFVDYQNGEFVYEQRNLDQVSFDLYTNEDIYLGDTLLWKANTRLTQDMINTSIWNKELKHNAVIDTVTDSNGEIHYTNLPLGRYYLIETANAHNTQLPIYHIWNTKLAFEIKAGEDNLIMGGKYINKAIPANCFVEKVDKTEKTPLWGAKFTLYAHIQNTNFDGYPLFSVKDTVPAVTARDEEGNECIAKETWIPLKTVQSDKNGMAEFNLELPYGQYMVTEITPPEGYGLSAGDSYIFTHQLETNNTYPNGANYTHIFENEKSSNIIVIRKYGELITGTNTIMTEYGCYEELKREKLPVEEVTFEIYNEKGNLVEILKTDEKGIAKSGKLSAPGIYTVKEVDNGGSLLLETEAKTVYLEENKTALPQIKEIEFTNNALSTKLKIYKQAEIPELSKQTPKDVSTADNIYVYRQKPIKGAVFGIYTHDNITDYHGNIIVFKDSCVGYAKTNAEGIAVFNQKLCSGSYYYQEVQTADDSYIPDKNIYDFDILLDGRDFIADLNKDSPVVNEKCKGSIQVIKKSGDGKICLKGVHFNLLDRDKTVIGSFITDIRGQIHINNLPLGTYYFQETQTQKNYILDNSLKKIILSQSNLSPAIEILNQRKKDNSIVAGNTETIPEDTKIKKSENAKTGDFKIWMVWSILEISVILLFCLCGYRIRHKKR